MRFGKLLIVLLWVTGVGCEPAPPAPQPIVRPVRYQQVELSGGSRVRTFSGTAQAGIESTLSFKVTGTILRIPVKVGDAIRAGQLIAELDQKDFLLQVQEAEATLLRTKAEARNAAANYDRVRALYENRNISRNELDAARTGAESLQATVTSAEKQLELARRQFSYTRLTAPIAGAIATKDVEVNENVSPGQPVVSLNAGVEPEVQVTVPEILISQITEGDSVSVHFDALPDQDWQAVVTEVGVAATGMATTFPVTVRLEHSPDVIRPGMAAEVAFQFRSQTDTPPILVPPVAVGEDQDGRYVFVLQDTATHGEAENGRLATAHRRSVQIGELTPQGLEIKDGLTPGELIATAGVRRIIDGLTVRLLDATQSS